MIDTEDNYDVNVYFINNCLYIRYWDEERQERVLTFYKAKNYIFDGLSVITQESGTHHASSHPAHYNQHPSGVECIDIVKHMNFPLGNAIKYIWRCDFKGTPVEDLRKAIHYLEIEIERRTNGNPDKI